MAWWIGYGRSPASQTCTQYGHDAIKVSIDPMIAAMRDTIDPFARSVREDYETNVEAPFAKGGEKIARALFALRGVAMYPDATGTLRLSFGQAKGPVKDNGIGPFVTTGINCSSPTPAH